MEYIFIHKRRNRLTNDKVEKLVFIYINYSLLDDKDEVNYARMFIDGEDDDPNDGIDDVNENQNENVMDFDDN